MSRPHWHPRSCKVCGITDADAHISQKGYCVTHSLERQLVNNAQLEAGAGPFYDHWLRRWALAARRRLVALDASQAAAQGVQSDT